jgi:hypothetical protein
MDRRLSARRRLPKAPVNARIEHADGRVISLELAYRGCDAEGVHVWVATVPVKLKLDEGWCMRVDLLPARTRIYIGRVE